MGGSSSSGSSEELVGGEEGVTVAPAVAAVTATTAPGGLSAAGKEDRQEQQPRVLPSFVISDVVVEKERAAKEIISEGNDGVQHVEGGGKEEKWCYHAALAKLYETTPLLVKALDLFKAEHPGAAIV